MSTVNYPIPIPLPRTPQNLAKTLWYKFYRHLPSSTVSLYGSRFKAVNYRVLERAFVTHEYEPLDLEFLRTIFVPGSKFVDVGANIGIYSLFASLAGASKVFAFEPSSREFDLFKKNITLNKRSYNIFPIQKACSSSSHQHEMNIATDRYRGANSLGDFYYEDTPLKTTETVWSTTLDLELGHLNFTPLDTIKIDTDGHEYEVLVGARRILSKATPTLLIEYPTEDVINLLTQLNYTSEWHEGMFNTVFRSGRI